MIASIAGMSRSLPFRRARWVAFACPHCKHRSAACLVGATYEVAPRSFAILYKCERCGGCARQVRPRLMYAAQFVLSLLVFALAYVLLLNLAHDWLVLIPALILVAGIAMLLSYVLARVTSRYVAADSRGEPW